MKVYYSLEDFNPVDNLVVTIGTFDGVHLGHRKLISRIREVASDIGGETLIITFFPHPRMILYPQEHGVELLNTTQEKSSLLEETGIDHLIIQPFDREFSELSSEDFIRKILVKKLKVRKLIIGYDHRFGKNREGGFEELLKYSEKYGFEVEEIAEEDVNDIAVSSTQVRNALKRGDAEVATSFLGRPYTLTGMVMQGNKIGRTIGFPTANLQIAESYKLIPSEGVYVVEVELMNEIYYGMLSIGRRPTLEHNGKLSIEVYILDFNREIYGSEITLKLLKWIRDDRRFASLDELTKQINNDLIHTLNYLGDRNK